MTSSQHAAWIRRGSPWRLARPLLALRDRLRGYGYTVYDIGNTSHLDAQPPEHHCPYSEVNWPSYVGKPMPDVVTADDIMSPTAGSGLPSLQALGAQIFADKQAGDPAAAWIVDMNWGPTSNSTAVRDTWRPGHVRGSSGDTGHIHLSCRSDCIDSPAGDTYDPVARLRGLEEDDMTPEQELALGRIDTRVAALFYGMDANTLIDPPMRGEPNQLKAQIAGVAEAVAAGQVTPTAEQWASLTAALEAKFESVAEAAAEAAVRRVLGGLDGATPAS